MPFKQYLAELQKNLKSGQATEASYYSALKSLLEALDPGLQVIIEPKHIEVGHPDFRIARQGRAIEFPVGHIEAKDIGEDLAAIEKTDQLKRYLHVENLILTDFLEFRWYADGQKRLTARLGRIHGNKLAVDPKGEAAVRELLEGFLRHPAPPVRTPKELALRMARLAHLIRGVILGAFEREPETGKLHKQFEAFQATLIPDLKPDVFADMYAQTVAYGLFAAACQPRTSTERFTREKAAHLIPKTNPFLRKLFNEIAGPDLDERIRPFVDDLVAVLRDSDLGEILADFGKRTGREDPVVHFYEDFLQAYDRKVREMRGVYYTPEPVVSYIVRSIDHLLKTRFNKPDGLADPDVLILDPACGTGTFLYYVIRHIYDHLCAKGQQGAWNSYVSQNLLKRVFGFELLMAPYAVAHLKLGLMLKDLGYQFDTDERLGIYLTNTLEEAIKRSEVMFAQWIADEANAAAAIKKEKPIMVVLGNPPYERDSKNKGPAIERLMESYKADLEGEQNIQPLSDDYIKFIRFADDRIERTGYGIVGYVTNHTYLSGVTHRSMRKALRQSFSQIFVLDLHGSTKPREAAPQGVIDKNVFEIQKGVAISLFVRIRETCRERNVMHAEIWGNAKSKAEILSSNDVSTTEWKALHPDDSYSFFVPRDFRLADEFHQGWELPKVFRVFSSGIKTHRDHFVVDFDKKSLEERISRFRQPGIADEELRATFDLQDNRDWKLAVAAQKVRVLNEWKSLILNYLYRPFDRRHIFLCEDTIDFSRPEVTSHLAGKDNICIISGRAGQVIHGDQEWHLIHVASLPVDVNIFYRGGGTVFPLFLYGDGPQGSLTNPSRKPNIAPEFEKVLRNRLGLDADPIEVLNFIYAVLHAPGYRQRYAEFLKIDFPRVPLTSDKKLFRALVEKGRELVALHLMESPKLNEFITRFPESGDNTVEKVRYEVFLMLPNDPRSLNRVYINKKQYFEGVPPDVWEFHIGGYQVCEKWLKDRKGRQLSNDDIMHYQKVVVALNETIRLMREIDEVIPGWPLP